MRSGDPSTPTWNFPCSLRDRVCRRMHSRSWSGCTGRSIGPEPPAPVRPRRQRRRGERTPRCSRTCASATILSPTWGRRRSPYSHRDVLGCGLTQRTLHRHRRLSRLHDRIRRGRAGLDPSITDLRNAADLPASGRRPQRSTTHAASCSRRSGTFVLGHQPPTDYATSCAAGRGEILRCGAADPERAAVDFRSAARHDHRRSRSRTSRCLLRVVRNRRPSLHEPRDAAPGHARALRPGPRERHHPEGVRERWRALSAGPGRRDRRAAVLSPLGVADGIHGGGVDNVVRPVHRHSTRYLLVLGACRGDPEWTGVGRRGCAVRPGALVPHSRDECASPVQLPGRSHLLSAAAG